MGNVMVLEKEQGNNSAEYEKDYETIVRLEADIDILEKKKKDYERILVGVQNDFNAAAKAMAPAKVKLDELTKFGFKKLIAKIRRKYDALVDEYELAIEAEQLKLNDAKYRLSDTKGRLQDINEVLARTKDAYEKHRVYMKKTYTTANAYEDAIKRENVKIQGIVKEIDEAITAIDEVCRIAEETKRYFEQAKNSGVAEMLFDNTVFMSLSRYNNINDAESLVHTLNASVTRMNKELSDVNQVYRLYVEEFDSSIKFVEITYDNFYMDSRILNQTDNNITRISAYLIRLYDIRKNLEYDRKISMTRLHK